MNKNIQTVLLIIVIILTGFFIVSNLNFKCFKLNNFLKTEKQSNNLNTNNIQSENEYSISILKDRAFSLKLDNGTDKKLINIIGEGDNFPDTTGNKSPDSLLYTFDSIYEDINCYGVNVEYYVGMDGVSSYLLVNKKNGEQVNMPSGNISISPDKKRIISYNIDLLPGFSFNGFKIVRMEDDHFITETELGPMNWGPINAIWLNDTEIEIYGEILDNNGDYILSKKVKYKFINNKWVEDKIKYKYTNFEWIEEKL